MDEVIRSDMHYQEHTGELTHRMTQPSEKIILDRNSRLRNNPGAIKDLGHDTAGGTWGRMVATVPEVMVEKAIRDGFELNSRDAKHAGLEMNRFLQTDAGKSCLIQG